MGIIVNTYKKNFLQRYDKDEAIPYYSASDFAGLVCEEGSFDNSAGAKIAYFTAFFSVAGFIFLSVSSYIKKPG